MMCKQNKKSKVQEDDLKFSSSTSYSSCSSPDSISNQAIEECKRKSGSKGFPSIDISELRKRTDLIETTLSTGISIEKEQINGLTYDLNFSIFYNTLFGERIVITGAPEFLGSWDPLRGLELEWSSGNLWKVNILLGEGVLNDFEYKYVCIKKQTVLWETGNNRIFKISGGVQQNLSIIFNIHDIWQVA